MKLSFRWVPVFDSLKPFCESDLLTREGISPLACVLMDSGGLSVLDCIAWIDEGLKRIQSIKSGAMASMDWGRDAWGACLSKAQVKVYSLYDDDCFEILSLEAFEIALRAWKGFISCGPNEGGDSQVDLHIEI